MKNNLILICSFFLFLTVCHAQKVKMKNNVIFINGKETLRYAKKSHNNEYVIYELHTKNEIINVVSNINDGYKKILFVKSKKSLETTLGYWNKSFIKWLIEQDVMTIDGKLNNDQIDIFIEKYDEKITERKVYRN
ncbi:hypothetical protein [Tenacibaculum sp. Mcav3-52]|uniref:hypothetical protein n=1 Tax=Tenacibaculum sp. Mcav3-52 TaxID=2917762 RepID=UPI001EF1AF88|nr:hypothetical protein [Tenacibaculum sp. Mcav3-52]